MKAQLRKLRKIQHLENPDPKFHQMYNKKTLLYATALLSLDVFWRTWERARKVLLVRKD